MSPYSDGEPVVGVIDADLSMLHLHLPGSEEPPEHKYLHRGEVVVVLCVKVGLANVQYYEVLTRHGIGWLWIFDVKYEIP